MDFIRLVYFVTFQMFSSLVQRISLKTQHILRITSAASNASITSGQYSSNRRTMSSSEAINQKFKLPKRYESSTISVWWGFIRVHFVKLKSSMNYEPISFDSCFFHFLVRVCQCRNEYVQLAMKYQPVNLGQGFTDYPVPQYITDALAATANNSNCLLNQYTRGFVSYFIPFFLNFVSLFMKISQNLLHRKGTSTLSFSIQSNFRRDICCELCCFLRRWRATFHLLVVIVAPIINRLITNKL